ncbi:hypothetical protein KI387_033524, partial [Taxus chinensis]
MRETRGSAGSGETGRRRTNAFWDIWDENARRTRFGCFGRKWNSLPDLILGHLEHESAKDAVQ